ncbi:MAG: hypothetical protein ACM3KH_00515 [Thiobacillus sp.]
MNEIDIGCSGDQEKNRAGDLISDKSLLRSIEYETGGVDHMAKHGRVELESRLDQQEEIRDALDQGSIVLIESMKRQGASYVQAQISQRYFPDNNIDVDLRKFSIEQPVYILGNIVNQLNVKLGTEFESLDEIGDYLSSTKQNFLVAIDELSALRDYEQDETRRILELLALLKGKKSLKFLGQIHRNEISVKVLDSGVTSDIKRIRIRPLNFNETTSLIDGHFGKYGVAFDEKSIRKIMALTGGWPAETLTLVKTFYDESVSWFNPRKTFTESDIDTAKIEENFKFDGMISLIHGIYLQRLNAMFTADEVSALTKISIGEHVEDDKIIHTLINWHVVARDEGGQLYIVGDLFRRCVEESGGFK